MTRAYDEYDNVVDLVKWENEIYNKALDEIEYNLLRNIDHNYFYPTSDFRYAIYDLVRDALYDTIKELTKEVEYER